MSEPIWWPHEPPDDAVVLVRAVGTLNVEEIERALYAGGFDWCAGAHRKDDVTFYVPEFKRAEAEKFVGSRAKVFK